MAMGDLNLLHARWIETSWWYCDNFGYSLSIIISFACGEHYAPSKTPTVNPVCIPLPPIKEM
jgi:hypothetical protein